MEIVDPTRYPGWDDLLANQAKGCIFHSCAWARLLSETYGYSPRYLLERMGGELAAMIPLMEVGGGLMGRRGVALPFSDYADPLFNSASVLSNAWEMVISEGKRMGWKAIELRCRGELPSEFQAPATLLHHQLNLEEGEEAIHRKLRSSMQRNLRKAEKEGVAATISHSREAVEDFYRLNCLTRKEHGLPPQPSAFFRRLYDLFIGEGSGFVSLARHGGKAIAANIFLRFGDRGYYKYGASDRRHQHLRGSNTAMWQGILHCRRMGIKLLCLGRTEAENQGLRQFKTGWGATETSLAYYKYNVAKRSFTAEQPPVAGMHNMVFRRLPVPVLRALGAILYKYAG